MEDSDTVLNSSLNSTVSDDNFMLQGEEIGAAYAAFSVLVVVALVGNSVMIWMILAHDTMRTRTNFFILSLATSDTLVTIFNTGFLAVYNIHYDWIFGGPLSCKLIQFSGPFCVAASIGTHLAICYERHRVILTPLRPRMSKRAILCIISAIWGLACVFSLPYLLVYTTFSDGSRTICVNNINPHCGQFCFNLFNTLYFWSRFVLLYSLPLVVMAGMYARISVNLWTSRIPSSVVSCEPTAAAAFSHKLKAKRKLVLMLITLVVIFALTWVVFHVFIIIHRFSPNAFGKHALKAYLVVFWVAMSNTMYNPMVYCSLNNKFRNGFKYVFRWLPGIAYSHAQLMADLRGRTPGAVAYASKRRTVNVNKPADMARLVAEEEL